MRVDDAILPGVSGQAKAQNSNNISEKEMFVCLAGNREQHNTASAFGSNSSVEQDLIMRVSSNKIEAADGKCVLCILSQISCESRCNN